MMTAHRAGSRACSLLMLSQLFRVFLPKKHEPATRRWARNEALGQLRGIEPATREMVNLYCTGLMDFSDAAFAVPTNQIID